MQYPAHSVVYFQSYSKIYKIQISEVGHVGHVTYSLINMLFISTGIFDDKLRPQILSVGTTANYPLIKLCDATSKVEDHVYLMPLSTIFPLYGESVLLSCRRRNQST
jgi:ABC-type enterochelin transport system permease subunit